ncbi:vWA domain-containing protein [Kineosporia babensis]|uniref:VWA domain-containing protein n=1 Tax=Kineosporia babensis TaxID=499548 RepID=A0A9X1SSA3_9ACTN|nr:vWA domain-containing protein [Kineosporia babensis]MCD5310452.1 VWA domain-containing protein [Kineosporia babensis]
MTDPNFTAIAVVMDRSGSMAGIARDAEQALAAFIAEQAGLPGRCTIRLADFDTEYTTVYPSTPIDQAPAYELRPRGGTALLDALGRTITEFGEELAALPEDQRPGNVVLVVQTDGHENSSQEWTHEQVLASITRQSDEYGWNFVFLGANQDAIDAGGRLGFKAEASITYAASGAGVRSAMKSASSYVGAARRGEAAGFTAADRQAATSEPQPQPERSSRRRFGS